MAHRPLHLLALLSTTALAGTGFGPTALAQSTSAQSALPTGGHVVSGGVGIGAPQGGAMAITQSSPTAIVNWQGFSIGQGHRVDIQQPDAHSAILNRVTGSTPSTIAGQLNANGQVYLVNPNGIAITRSGQVNAGGGFVASTLGIGDEDFKAGRRQFRGAGASADVSNQGRITVSRGGYAALIGGQVSNSGTITVPMGRVGLGSGEQATLDLSGDSFLQMAVPTNAKGQGTLGRDALVSNGGTISADGGAVTLTAAAARDMARQAVNLSGTIEARTVSGRNGGIVLSGGEGTVAVAASGRIDATGADHEAGGRVRIHGRRLDVAGTVDVSGARGGRVAIRGAEHLALSGRVLAEGRTGRGGRIAATAPAIETRAALIDASGATGGGTVRLGGGRQGGGSLAHAQTVSVDAGTTIRADATGAGTGGDVVVWSDGATRFSGTITARGGAAGGDGGQAEVSSKGHLAYEGRTDLTAAKGAFGTLLLDPYDVTISTGADGNQAGFVATGTGSVINATTLLTALGSANVTVSTGTAGSEAGAITLAAGTPLAWTTGATLTLQAAGGVTLDSAVTAPAGGLTIAAGGAIGATGAVSVARFTLASGDWVQNAATLPGFAAGDFQVASGASFLRAAGGAGTNASPYLLADIYGVQGMGTSAAYRTASYQLAGDIDASGTTAWNGGAGFSPVGDANNTFTGSLDGASHTITGLTIARPNQNYVGLFGYLDSGGRIGNLGLVGGSVSGLNTVGGLAGANGGLVSQSYATATVSGLNTVGGLVGINVGTVSQSYAAGGVSGTTFVGGLVGRNFGSTVTQSYATGSVTASNYVGGLVGVTFGGTISQSYASGRVAGSSNLGGLIGYSSTGTRSSNYWDTDSTGQSSGVGGGASTGLTGLTAAQARDASNYTGFDFSTVWYQTGDMRPILRMEAAPAVGGVIPVSNLHQLQLMGANLAGSYRLTANLDASATAATATSAGIWGAGGFVPVGASGNAFTGSLDGAGHTITGLTIARSSQSFVGLFGWLNGGTVSGIGLVGGSISGALYVGGLVGVNNNYSTVSQSYVTGSVSGSSYVGGLVGYNNFNSTVSQSYATGTVSGSGYVGGLVGYNNMAGTVSQSYATGAVSGSSYVGGLVGSNVGVLTNTYWDTDSTGQTSGVGSGSSTGVTGLSAVQARAASNYSGFDFFTVWYQAGDIRPILRSEAAAADTSGVIPVSNLHQLQLMGANLAGSYRLTANLDASATAATATSAGIWGAGGFVPVGNYNAGFTGSLDGAGHTITGLTIARPSRSYVGLFGKLGSGGRIDSVGLVGGSVSGSSSVGSLVGYNAGTVSRSSATGSVSGSSSVGSLIGYNDGTVSRSSATGSVSGTNDYVGGLVGVSFGTVSQSSATGSVSGSTNVGGLVGYNYGTISQTYATGAVSGSSYVGGLAGYNSGTVSQSYATGAVSGSSSVGGLVGQNDNTLTNTYWNTQTAGQSSGVGDDYGSPGGATGLTTAQMQDLTAFRTTYAGFDFDTVWAPPNQAGQGGLSTAYYPQLYALSPVVAVAVASSRTYGSANPGPIASYAGVRPGDFVTTLGSLTTTATPSSNVGSYAATVSGSAVTSAAGNSYRIVSLPGTLTVTPATITVAGATGVDKTYDATTALPGNATGFTSSGVLFNDAVTVSAASAAYGSADAGSRAVLVSGLTLTGAGAGNYVLSATSVIGAGTITAAPLTITAADAAKTYDGQAFTDGNGVTYAGFVANETASVLGGSLAYGGTAQGAVNAGQYGITVSGLTSNNYAITYAPGTLTVAQKTLTAGLAGPVTKTYDGTRTATLGAGNYTLSGIVGSDAVITAGTGATYDTADAGTSKTVTATGLTLLGATGNYVLASTTASASVGTITPAALTITATSAGKIYDGQAFTGGYGVSYSGFVANETSTVLGGSLTYGGTAQGAVNTGRYGITPGGLTSNNYAITYVPGTFTVVQKPLTAGLAGSVTKTYDGTTTATLGAGNYTLSGIVGSDAVTTAGSATYDTANAGTGKTVTATGLSLSGAAASNYVLASTSTSAAVGTITQAALTVTANDAAKTYDGRAFTGGNGVSYSGFVNGEGTSVLGGTLAYGGTAQGAVNAGSYTIAASGQTAANYAITYVPGTLTVLPKSLTASLGGSASKVYDGTTAAGLGGLTYALSGIVGSDAVTAAGIGAAYDTANAGTGKAVTATGLSLSGAAASNYVLASTSTSAAVGTITQAALTVTANDAGKTYDGRAFTGGNGVTYAGFVANETSTVLGGSPTYGGTSQGAVNAGWYGITVGGLTSNNYAITYAPGTLTVAQRPITVVANPLSRTYGDANPALTYTVGGRGLVNGDALTGTLATAATPASDIGPYAITQGTLAASANYALSYTGATLTVIPRAIIAGSSQTGGSTPDLSTLVTSSAGGVPGLDGISRATVTATITGSGIGNFSTGLITASGSNASHTIPLNVAVDTSGSGGLSIDTRRLVLISDCKGGQSCYVVSNPPATFDDAPTGTTGLIGRPSASSPR